MNHDDFDWGEEKKKLDPELIKRYTQGIDRAKREKEGKSETNKASKITRKPDANPSIDLHWEMIPGSLKGNINKPHIEVQLTHLKIEINKLRKRGHKSIRIIHGKGEGVLKEAVREWAQSMHGVQRVKSIVHGPEAGAAVELIFD